MSDEQTGPVQAIPSVPMNVSSSIHTPPPHPLDGEWYTHSDGQTFGPFTGHQLRDFVRDGRLNADSEVARVGAEAWTKAAEDKILVPLFAAASPPAPPSGNVSAERGATVVQVTNHIAAEPKQRPVVFIDTGDARPKSAGTALILSILIVGLGQCYNGQIGKGILMLIGCILLWFVFLGWIINIWSWIDAYQTAKAMNDRYLRLLAAGTVR